GDGFLVDEVSKLRHATRNEMRRRALRARNATRTVFRWR
ncbi:hypothetical protein A2U01_0056790, partial [Trifolium medium]|nr:hypothetical protein [Trifolium medium]